MYQLYGLQDYLYLLLYGAAMMSAILSCLYLLLRRHNFLSQTEPPLALRRWAAAFLAAVAMSHVWWIAIGTAVLGDDTIARNAINIMLDSVTMVPTMMATLLTMLQDRRRPVWPVFAAVVPTVIIALWAGIAEHNPEYEKYICIYMFTITVCFVIYMAHAVRQYGRWLRNNYADMEHKEVWQSLVFLLVIMLMFLCYKTNYGETMTEYLVQLYTLLLIGFLLWRVETLQQLDEEQDNEEEENMAEQELEKEPAVNSDETVENVPIGKLTAHIGKLLKTHCEAKHLYLQHDISLSRLSTAIGTNRTYLGQYFQQQGITYNTYINQLRINHFVKLYRKADKARPFSVQEAANNSGYQSYRTFATVFKNIMGMTASEWMEKEKEK